MDRPIVAGAIINRLELFGGATLTSAGGPITGRAVQRHRIALLALLSTTRRLQRSRDRLVALLWPEADAERGRKLLSDSIYRVNQAFGGDAISGTGEDIRLNRNQIGSDVADFEAAIDAGEWRRAVDLYAGPFLDGFYLPDAAEFDQWVESERAGYARVVSKALEMLAVGARDAGRFAEAAEWWHKLAAHVPDDSRVAMELMRALEASSNRAGALRHARVHTALLRQTLGVEPEPALLELARQIERRSDALPIPSAPATPTANVGERVSPPTVSIPQHTTVDPQPAPVAPVAPESGRLPRSAPPRRSRLLFAVAGAALGLIAVIAVIRFPRSTRATPDAPTTPGLGNAIAVLPFTNVSESDSTAYFADGMSEELMYLLQRTRGLRVASPTSSFAYRDLKLDVREVARRLHVDWIVEGSVRRSGSKLRIVARLTDARNGYQIWSESFDRASSDVFAIQEEIATAITEHLASAVGGELEAAKVRDARGPSDPEVYDIYLQARFQWHRRTDESLTKSAALFEQVVARAPNYARAWAGLADAYAVLAFYDYLAPRVAYPKADSAAHQAIQLDSTLAAPYATLAYVDTYYHWNWASAEEGFRRAIELEPGYSTAHQWYSNLLTARGRFDEAEREMRRAAELDPLSMIAHAAIGWVLMLANQNDRAIQQLRGAMQLDPNFQLAHYWTGLALEQKAQPLEAIPVFQRALALSNDNPLVLAAIAHAQASAGRADSARAILRNLLAREKRGLYIPSYEVAKAYLALGDISTALTRLERAHADRAHSMAFLNVDPQLRPLAGERRFQRLVARVQ